jgi:hypothetical protein
MAGLVLTCTGLGAPDLGAPCRDPSCRESSRPITSEPAPIPPFCKQLQIAWMVVSTVQVRNMRYMYVVGRDRQAATG